MPWTDDGKKKTKRRRKMRMMLSLGGLLTAANRRSTTWQIFFYQTRLYQNEAEPKRIKHAIQCKKVLTWDHGAGLKCCDMPRVTKISKLFSGSVQYIVLTCDYWNVELLFSLEETEPFSKKRASFFFLLKHYIMFKIIPCRNLKILLMDGGANNRMTRF